MPERKLGSKFIKRFLKTSEDEILKKKNRDYFNEKDFKNLI